MNEQSDAPGTTAAPAKVDPETLVLRSRPARAIRFKRGAIVSIAAIGSIGLVGTAWIALRPATFRIVSQVDERAEAGRAPIDALSQLPATYGDAPKLGPPLPGDLGRPILEHQRAMSGEQGAGPTAAQLAAQAAASERERLQAELKAARESGVIAAARTGIASIGVQATSDDRPGASPEVSKFALDADSDPNRQQRKLDFVGTMDSSDDRNPHVLSSTPSPYTLSAGSVISAALVGGLRSDLPGLVIAQVSERVYDSATGSILLIPQGARLVGSYDSVVAFGQRRALVVWQRIILPDGRSLKLDNVPATDPAGYSGLADKVDFHTWTLLKGIVLSTILGVGSNLTFGGESDLVQAIRESSQQNAAKAGDQITSRNLEIQPTITIRPGARVRLVVHRDLVLAPWRE